MTISSLWKPGEKPDTYFHIAIVEDITGRKQAEQALQAILQNMPQMSKLGIILMRPLSAQHVDQSGGFAATRQIRKMEAFFSIPIVTMTAYAMAGDCERYLATGMNNYASKPVDAKELAAVIEKWCGDTPETATAPDSMAVQKKAGISKFTGRV